MLSRHIVHIWIIDIENYSKDIFWSILDEQEKIKANRYQFDKSKTTFIVTRGSLKTILAKYLQTKPQEIVFDYTNSGKPILKNKSKNDLFFNVSHSKDLGLIGVTCKDDLGIDVEYIEDLENYNDLIKRFFSKTEHSHFMQLASGDKKKAFYNSWTKKEAYIKATGEGFRRSLSSFSVSFDSGHEEYIHENLKWNFFTGEIQPQYTFSVVKKGPIDKIEYLMFS